MNPKNFAVILNYPLFKSPIFLKNIKNAKTK
ncbi:hypothetical protein N871_04235 [Helicobacter pylori X47-2AL]|uniref:Uncharacterized protein n=1 Tax=Helicobacter pylori X47-2AL TaxID=1386083 RepID=V6LIA2_HELPX|nr:hypothetical protein N871_04235 [Helicobacter pylori X47-2AL]